jgi:hypothetical protein
MKNGGAISTFISRGDISACFGPLRYPKIRTPNQEVPTWVCDITRPALARIMTPHGARNTHAATEHRSYVAMTIRLRKDISP